MSSSSSSANSGVSSKTTASFFRGVRSDQAHKYKLLNHAGRGACEKEAAAALCALADRALISTPHVSQMARCGPRALRTDPTRRWPSRRSRTSSRRSPRRSASCASSGSCATCATRTSSGAQRLPRRAPPGRRAGPHPPPRRRTARNSPAPRARARRIRDCLHPQSVAAFSDLWVCFDYVDLDLRKLIASPQVTTPLPTPPAS